MNDIVNVWILGENGIERLLVGDVGIVQLGANAGQQLNPIENFLGRVVHVVDNDYLVAGVQQGQASE
jgi:hypothetical protein